MCWVLCCLSMIVILFKVVLVVMMLLMMFICSLCIWFMVVKGRVKVECMLCVWVLIGRVDWVLVFFLCFSRCGCIGMFISLFSGWVIFSVWLKLCFCNCVNFSGIGVSKVGIGNCMLLFGIGLCCVVLKINCVSNGVRCRLLLNFSVSVSWLDGVK